MEFSVDVNTRSAEQNLKNLESSLKSVSNTFKTLLGAASIGALVNFSDSITGIRNRLNQLVDTNQEVQNSFQALAAIALSARTPLEQTADLYFRIAKNADQLGISQREAAQITESVAKAISASGLSAAEAAGPLLQLGQALQSGRFQGDELRSILEGLPPVARALADNLGVPIGALKELGSQGKISGQDFVNAMRQAKDSIEQDFARTVPTISQAFTNLRTAIGLAFNNLEQGSQASQNLAGVINNLGFTIFRLSQSVDAIIGPLGTFIKILLAIASVTIVGRVLTALRAGFVALQSTIQAVTGGVATGITMWKNLWNNLGLVISQVGQATSKFSVLGAVATMLLSPFSKLLQLLGKIGAGALAFLGIDKLFEEIAKPADTKALEDYNAQLDKFKNQLSDVANAPPAPYLNAETLNKQKKEIDGITEGFSRSNAELLKRIQHETDLIGLTDQQQTMKQALFDLEENYLKEVTRLTDLYREKSQSSNAEERAGLKEIETALQTLTAEYQAQLEPVMRLTQEKLKALEADKERLELEERLKNLSEFSINSRINSERQLRDIQADIAKSTMSEIEKKYYDIQRAAEESARQQIETENARRRGLKLGPMSTAEEKAYYDAAVAGVKKLQDAEKQRFDNNRTWDVGYQQAFNDYVENARNAAERAANFFKKATQGMEDAIVNFAKTGKFEWKSFVASMAEELLRSQIKQLMANLFNIGSQSGGSSGGNFLSSLGNLLGFANGGIIPTNGPVLVGERGPEILTGAAGRTVIPNEQAFGGTNITYNINAVDAPSFKQMIAADPTFLYAVTEQGRRRLPGAR